MLVSLKEYCSIIGDIASRYWVPFFEKVPFEGLSRDKLERKTSRKL